MHKKDQIHPQDFRNLLIFGLLSIILWGGFEFFVLGPQTAKIEQAAAIRAKYQKNLDQHDLAKQQEILTREQALKLDPGQETQEKPSIVSLMTTQETAPPAPARRVRFFNDMLSGSFSLKGGRFDDLLLSNYFETIEHKEHVSLLSPRRTKAPRFIDYGWVSKDENVKLPDENTLWRVANGSDLAPGKTVTLVWDNGQGLTFERTIDIDENYVFRITQRVINNTAHAVELYPYALITQTGLPEHLEGRWISHEGPIGFIGGKLVEYSYKDMQKGTKDPVKAQRGWIGFTDKYWLTALIPSQNKEGTYRFNYVPDVQNADQSRYQIDYTGPAVTIAPGAQGQAFQQFYTGAKKLLLLEKYEKILGVDQLSMAVDFGWFWFLTYPFFFALHYLGQIFGNMGIAIILLTILLRGAATPLLAISMTSMVKMKKVGPQTAELRKQYGDDKQGLQQAIMELYQKEGVNPMSGCLPMFFQIPIFFSFYKILFITIELRQAPFFGWIKDLSVQDPTNILNLFGLLHYDVPQGLPEIGIWPCLMCIAMLIQRNLNPPPQDPTQRAMMKFFPFFITYIMSKFAAGLVIYWTVSAVVGIVQQIFIMRRLGVPVHLFGQSEEDEALEKAVDQGPSVHPLAAMAEEEFEEASGLDLNADGTIGKPISKPKPKKSKPKTPAKKSGAKKTSGKKPGAKKKK